MAVTSIIDSAGNIFHTFELPDPRPVVGDIFLATKSIPLGSGMIKTGSSIELLELVNKPNHAGIMCIAGNWRVKVLNSGVEEISCRIDQRITDGHLVRMMPGGACGQSPVPSNLPTFALALPAIVLPDKLHLTNWNAAKCECGGDTARTTHSTWCPKHGQ